MKIKLRDMTIEDMKVFDEKVCSETPCSECIFNRVSCGDDNCWVRHKELYSDEFLNQEIEIPQDNLLTERDKAFLLNNIREIDYDVIGVVKTRFDMVEIHLRWGYNQIFKIQYPPFTNNYMFRNLEKGKLYSLEDLGLNEEN